MKYIEVVVLVVDHLSIFSWTRSRLVKVNWRNDTLVVVGLFCLVLSPKAHAQCPTIFVPPARQPLYCMTSTPEESQACKRQADQLYADQVERHRAEWERQRLACQAKEQSERDARKRE